MNMVRDIRRKFGLMKRFGDYVTDKSGVKTIEIINAYNLVYRLDL